MTERDLDRQLAGAFEAWASFAPPANLLARSLERVGQTRQRAAWRLPGAGLRAGATIGRVVVPFWVMLLLAAVLTAALAVAGSGLLRSTVVAEATPMATPTGQARSFSGLSDYQAQLVSDTVGWLGAGPSLYRTVDSGVTWSELQLPESKTPVARTFVDADTAFLAFAGEPWRIAATHDGGLSWTEASLSGTAASASMRFFAMHSASVGEAFLDNGIYRTQDGGRSWSGPIAPQPPKVAFFKLEQPDAHGVLSWSDGKADNKPFDDRLWLSLDGGESWMERSFPTDTASPAGGLKALSAEWMDGSHWLIAVNVETDAASRPIGRTTFYDSTDAGQSWRYVSQLPVNGVDMLSQTDWLGCATSCWSTRDGGATWRQTAGTEVRGASFASVTHAWLVVPCGLPAWRHIAGAEYCDGVVRSRLLETTDGGRTWQPIG
jgi:photosystem II stability/assembly factor-like uncharacterized protein